MIEISENSGRVKKLKVLLAGLASSHIKDAARVFEEGGNIAESYGESTGYDLLIDGKSYPPKAIFGLAASAFLNADFPSNYFTGGEGSTCFDILRKLGFEVVKKAIPLGLEQGLVPFEQYSRNEAAEIFSPGQPFKSGAGTWGLSGIINNAPGAGDVVLFVTLGAYDNNDYDDALTDDGLLIWSSQNQHTPDSKIIRQLVAHDENMNNVRLFLRASESEKYTYMGPLAFHDWDPVSTNPVHFKWRLMNWPLPAEITEHFKEYIRSVEERSEFPHSTPSSSGGQLRPGQAPAPSKKRNSVIPSGIGGVIDWTARDQRNTQIGQAGEELVMGYERRRLSKEGRQDLADKVEHVALSNSAAGFDILSFELDATPRRIEVKTTTGSNQTPFFISSNEVAVSQELQGEFWIYRLYNYNHTTNEAQFYMIQGAVCQGFELEPVVYRAKPKR